MNKADTIRMARKAAFVTGEINKEAVIERLYKAFNVTATDSGVNIADIHAVLDELIAAEREACAQMVERMGMKGYGTLGIAVSIRDRTRK
jgi:hypothetical protein